MPIHTTRLRNNRSGSRLRVGGDLGTVPGRWGGLPRGAGAAVLGNTKKGRGGGGDFVIFLPHSRRMEPPSPLFAEGPKIHLMGPSGWRLLVQIPVGSGHCVRLDQATASFQCAISFFTNQVAHECCVNGAVKDNVNNVHPGWSELPSQ
eukprot:scaffold170238_cov34-Tisochrysis_lutea.AAC.1